MYPMFLMPRFLTLKVLYLAGVNDEDSSDMLQQDDPSTPTDAFDEGDGELPVRVRWFE